MSGCPCGSGLSFESCCGPYIAGTALPPTAEALMRSRYSAYTVQDVDYICNGRAPEERANVNRPMVVKWARAADFLGLEIHRSEKGGVDDFEGEVEFSVYFMLEGRRMVHRELATFRKVDGRWYYVTGRMLPPFGVEPARLAVKAGRNDPCPCGSGKKYKKCCAAA